MYRKIWCQSKGRRLQFLVAVTTSAHQYVMLPQGSQNCSQSGSDGPKVVQILSPSRNMLI